MSVAIYFMRRTAMNLFEKLRICENYIKKKGYSDAAIVAAGLNSRMVILTNILIFPLRLQTVR